jgi:hypothetical protein
MTIAVTVVTGYTASAFAQCVSQGTSAARAIATQCTLAWRKLVRDL